MMEASASSSSVISPRRRRRRGSSCTDISHHVSNDGNNNNISMDFSTTGSDDGMNNDKSERCFRPSLQRHQAERIRNSISCSRLRFDRLTKLYGRNQEISTLQTCLDRLILNADTNTTHSHKELIWISGLSGTGKSRLALELKQRVIKGGGCFSIGKYEDTTCRQQHALTGLAQACQQIYQRIWRIRTTSPNTFHEIQQCLSVETAQILALVIPNIRDIHLLVDDSQIQMPLSESPTAKEKSGENTTQQQQQLNKGQLEAAIRQFFQVASKHLSPLVLVLDDLQWADPLTFSIIQALMIDEQQQQQQQQQQHDDSTTTTTNNNVSRNSTRMMLIGCYRSDEITPEHLVSQTKRDILATSIISEPLVVLSPQQKQQASPEQNLHSTEIQVGNLSVDDITDLLCDLLSMDDINERTSVEQLATICRERTQGNIFFIKSFLNMLQEEGFMKFHIGTFSWTWNIQRIQQDTCPTQNVVLLIQRQIDNMKYKTAAQLLLQFAACLGTYFDQDTLYLVWKNVASSTLMTKMPNDDEYGTNNEDDGECCLFEELLQLFIDNHCLEISSSSSPRQQSAAASSSSNCNGIKQQPPESCSPTTTEEQEFSSDDPPPVVSLKFAHDKIQEAALLKVPAKELAVLQYEVGMALYNHLDQQKLEANLFVVADLLRHGEGQSGLEEEQAPRPDIAKFFLRAAQKAKDVAAFGNVIDYVQVGIQNLSATSMWETDFELALDLHALGALAEERLGHHDEALKYCSIVMGQRKATALQKSPVYNVKLDILHKSQSPESLELALDFLAELGCTFPRQKLVRAARIGPYLRETIDKYIPENKEDLIKNLPMMKDPTKIAAMQLLERAGSIAFVAHDDDVYAYIRCRFVRWIGKYGLTEDCASAFSSFGIVCAHKYGYFDAGVKAAEICLSLQEKLDSKYYEARSLSHAHAFVLSFVHPLKSRLKYFLRGYNLGIQTGATFSAMTGIQFYLSTSFFAGTNLDLLLEDFGTYMPQLTRLKFALKVGVLVPIWQLALNLVGKSQNTSVLTGDKMNEEESLASDKSYISNFAYRHKCFACMFFRDYETAADLILERGVDCIKKIFTACNAESEYLPFGVCLYAAAGQTKTKRAKYVRLANACRGKVKALAKNGCVNHVHALSLLDAEFYALNKKVDLAKESYVKAITEAARGGFMQNAAVGSERFALYLCSLNQHRDAAYRMEASINYYKDWGASRKVDLLRREYAEKFEGDGATTKSMPF